MKVLLVNPPVPLSYYNREYYIPSSLVYLAAALERNGDEVKILDLKTVKTENIADPYKRCEELLLDAISEFNPEMIGFGCLYSGNFPDVVRFAGLSKSRFAKIPVVIGGIHPSIYPGEILENYPFIDWVVIGEGEETITRLINDLKNKQTEFEKIDGLAFRKDGGIIVNPKRHFIENLDLLPMPAYHLVNIKDYYVDTSQWHNPKGLPINTAIPIITSRSCPNQCNFCSMFMVMGPRWRSRSPENVVDEIEYLYRKYDHRHFSFMDDNLTLKKSHIMGICSEIIKRKLDIQFETPNGLSLRTLDKEVLDAMAEAGLSRVYLAIESGSDFIRNKIMRKNVSREKIFEIARALRGYKQVFINAFFIMGMPEETAETLADTYNMINELDVDRIYLTNAIPFPGTNLFKQALRDNLLIGMDVENLYRSNELYVTNYKRIFIKPYQLEEKGLLEFRARCDSLIALKNSRRAQLQNA